MIDEELELIDDDLDLIGNSDEELEPDESMDIPTDTQSNSQRNTAKIGLILGIAIVVAVAGFIGVSKKISTHKAKQAQTQSQQNYDDLFCGTPDTADETAYLEGMDMYEHYEWHGFPDSMPEDKKKEIQAEIDRRNRDGYVPEPDWGIDHTDTRINEERQAKQTKQTEQDYVYDDVDTRIYEYDFPRLHTEIEDVFLGETQPNYQGWVAIRPDICSELEYWTNETSTFYVTDTSCYAMVVPTNKYRKDEGEIKVRKMLTGHIAGLDGIYEIEVPFETPEIEVGTMLKVNYKLGAGERAVMIANVEFE